MRRFLVALLFSACGILAAPAASDALDTYPRQAGVRPEHYVFALTLSDASDEIVGEATVAIRFTKDGLTRFFLDLASVADGKGMTVAGVSSESVALVYAHSGNHLNITLDRPTRAGELRRFTIRYHGIPANGLRTGVNKYGERCFFSWNWPDKAREWLPMIDHPSAKATSEFLITAPAQYAVVANGLLQEEVMLGDGRKLTHWKQSVPIASWLNAIGVEQFGVHHGGYVKGVELQTWVSHQELPVGIARFEATARRAIEFYSDYIGPYSYEKMASVSAPFNRRGDGARQRSVLRRRRDLELGARRAGRPRTRRCCRWGWNGRRPRWWSWRRRRKPQCGGWRQRRRDCPRDRASVVWRRRDGKRLGRRLAQRGLRHVLRAALRRTLRGP
jgi:hypothetical protein